MMRFHAALEGDPPALWIRRKLAFDLVAMTEMLADDLYLPVAHRLHGVQTPVKLERVLVVRDEGEHLIRRPVDLDALFDRQFRHIQCLLFCKLNCLPPSLEPHGSMRKCNT